MRERESGKVRTGATCADEVGREGENKGRDAPVCASKQRVRARAEMRLWFVIEKKGFKGNVVSGCLFASEWW